MVSHRRGTKPSMETQRKRLGLVGERVAEAVLRDRGLTIDGRNVAVGKGEVDLIGHTRTGRVVVEVRTVRGELRLDERFPRAKRRQVGALASALGVHRVDLVGVALGSDGVAVHWLRDVATD